MPQWWRMISPGLRAVPCSPPAPNPDSRFPIPVPCLAPGRHPRIPAIRPLPGGTFLFVATAHILPEVMHSSGGLSWAEVGTMVFGTMLPLFLNFEHGH